ncbi:protein lifeguard 2-like isoform X2 [Tachyglossus aculeatus]|uniref:protein lifeguard 2-like isoform X2 n=1 Tax=Tachyglossus aculeatus TaxID=9261 RepID=UPI0018F3ECA2|nr:protein lifeguard 2-like isoform X2 [Tachyglossus aculeatus]
MAQEKEEPGSSVVEMGRIRSSSRSPDYADLDVVDAFSEKSVRRAFVRKVYFILALQMTVTTGIICMFLYVEPLNKWVQFNRWFTFALFPALFGLIISLACFEEPRRHLPLNFILLGLFTVLEGLLLGAVSAFFEVEVVLWALGATAFVSFGLSLFALQTRWDFTAALGFLWVLVLVLLAYGIIAAIVQTQWLRILYTSFGTLIFAMYLVVDTQLMLGGHHRYSLSPEDYVFAALNLYLDIFTLFLLILELIGLTR